MANRYWVGGAGNWDASTTTHWSATSGGSGGASVPGASDKVYFDSNSSGGTVTMTTSPTILCIVMNGFTGTLDANGNSPTMNYFDGASLLFGWSLKLGSGTWTINGNNGFSATWCVNGTLDGGSGTLKFTDTTSANLIFTGRSAQTLYYNNVWFARGTSTGMITVFSSNVFVDLKDTGTTTHSLVFQAGFTNTFTTFSVSGTVGNLITITSANNSTSTHTLSCASGIISCNYLNIQHSVATGGATWYAGPDSVNNQATSTFGSGWVFTAQPFTNPANVYGAGYATCAADSGVVSLQISKDGGTNWSVAKPLTLTTGTGDTTLTYGGVSDNWGIPLTGADINSTTNFLVRIRCGTSTLFQQGYKNFGFAESAGSTILGIKAVVVAKYVAGTPLTSIDSLTVTATVASSDANIVEGSTTYDSTLNTLTAFNGATWDVLLKSGGALGTPASGVMTNVTGTAANLTAGTTTTNANLTGDVTSSGNATTIAWTRNPYCFRAYASGATTLVDAASTKVLFATEDYDYNNNFASSTYTAPVAGVYHFDAGITMTPSATPVEAAAALYVNGSQIIGGQSSLPATVVNTTYNLATDILLAAGNTVEIYFYQNTAGNETSVTGDSKTWMSGHLVHRTA